MGHVEYIVGVSPVKELREKTENMRLRTIPPFYGYYIVEPYTPRDNRV